MELEHKTYEEQCIVVANCVLLSYGPNTDSPLLVNINQRISFKFFFSFVRTGRLLIVNHIFFAKSFQLNLFIFNS